MGAPPVAVVNQAWVKVNLEGRNPVGQRVTSFGLRMKPHEMEILGPAKNAGYDDLTGDFPAVVCVPFEQNVDVSVDEMIFFLRTAGIGERDSRKQYSHFWRYRLRAWDCTEPPRMQWRAEREKSGSAWRWVRSAARWSGWCCAMSCSLRFSGWRSVCRWRLAHRNCFNHFSSESNPVTHGDGCRSGNSSRRGIGGRLPARTESVPHRPNDRGSA